MRKKTAKQIIEELNNFTSTDSLYFHGGGIDFDTKEMIVLSCKPILRYGILVNEDLRTEDYDSMLRLNIATRLRELANKIEGGDTIEETKTSTKADQKT
jgi:hypothetical protein